ncbi:unnamed protein product [Rhizophagus irregularis]|nr:unnamed protein product [Rhizophagus irregularis]CAB4487716.1 unnamed protein product [Rhizophagus irregularis]CAB4488356.1 unnamed protein product [Rhizophagus irregularis]CAB4489294.1 unnamed protein product [Rhizophagus irregularis]
MPLSKQETQRQTILQFWRQGIRTAAKIHSLTKIPLRTIYRNLKKIKKTGDVKHRGGNGRISKITQKAAREIGQYIRRKPTITAKFIAAKLEDVGVNVSRSTVSSRVAKEFLKNNVPEVMDWPSNSPDLNPIENLWAIVKRNTELRRPKNLNELDVFLHEEWVKIPNNLLINLVNSMPQRCREVIDRNGERIPY